MWFKKSLVLIAVVFFIPGQNSFAADKNDAGSSSFDLGQIVVSATRREAPLSEITQAGTVIGRNDIDASPFERVEDIVRTVPGLFNFRHYALQRNGIINPLIMRGVGKNRVLLLVDGVPQNDNFNNSIAWVAWGHISKDAIERIEVIRGPASALYGSEGLGGVVNIITKDPQDRRRAFVRGQGGTADTYSSYGFHSRKDNDFGFLLSGGYQESDGFYMTQEPQSYEIKRYRKIGKVFGKSAYEITPESDISLAALYYDHETGKGREFFYDELTLDQYWINYKYKEEYFDLKGLVYFNRADKTAFQDTAKDNFSSLLRKEKMPAATWGADFQGILPLGPETKFTLGVAYKETSWDYDDEYITSSRDVGAEGKQRFISPFINLDFRLLDDNLIVNLGARYDWIETLDGANWDTQGSAGKPAYDNQYNDTREGSFSPKLGIVWHANDKTTIRASGGKGFRAPSLFELYKVHIRQGGSYYREANPNLKPEEIWSYDVGAERYLLDNLPAKLTFYQSFAKDYIGDRLTGTGTFGGGKTRYEYQLDNINKVDIYGIEAEVKWHLFNDLALFANYTYNVSKIKEDTNDASLEGNYLPHNPRHKVHFGFQYQNPKIVNISLIGNYYAGIHYDSQNTFSPGSYFTMDIAVWREIFEGVTVYLNAENIFDKKYPILRSLTSADTIAPGAIVTAGVKLEF